MGGRAYAAPPMTTDKRQRKRDGRQARLEAERAASRSAARRRKLITAVVAIVAVFVVLVLLSQTGGDQTAATDTTSDPATTDPSAPEAGAAAYGDTPCAAAEKPAAPVLSFDSPFEDCLEEGVDYAATFTTSAGEFTVDLLEERAPSTVNNFVNLARSAFYDGTPFHRVIEGFVAQGGSPDGSGSGGPGYATLDELPEEGAYELGSLVMANSGPDTQGSQLFVITGDQGVGLPLQYSLFGTVTAGMESVMAIELGEPPSEPTILESVEIIEQ